MEKLIVLGFGIRKPVDQQGSLWQAERRSSFLIRPEIPSPVSVDSDVWPVLAVNPDETFPLFLWGSVSEILAAFPEAARTGRHSPVIIEIAVLATGEQSSRYWEGIIFGRVNPEKENALKIAPECLGYDVADRYLVSGVSNCMLFQEELAAVRKDWTDAINIWGLFEEAEAARAFRPVCDRLIPEHAPFEAYRLRKIDLVEGTQESLDESATSQHSS